MKSYKYNLDGLDCANCAKKIENKIAATEGYKNVVVNFSTSKLSFQTDKEDGKEKITEEISKIVHSIEPDVIVTETQKQQKSERTNNDILRLIIGIFIYFIATIPAVKYFLTDTLGISMAKGIEITLTIIALAILLVRTAKKAWKQLTKNHVLDENMLITISTIGACLVGKTTEGVMVITLYEIGKILEARAVNKTRKSISDKKLLKESSTKLSKR